MNDAVVRGFAVILLGVLPPAVTADSCRNLFENLNLHHTQIVQEEPRSSKESQEDALRALESQLFDALSQCPKDADLYALMGEVQISRGQLPLAVVYGKKSVGLDGQSWRGQQLLGSTLAMLGQPREGLPYLERAVVLVPENQRLRLNLASALLAAKDYARARELCDVLIESTSAEVAAAAYNLRGQAYLRQGAISEAGRDFAAAEKLGFNPSLNLIDTETLRRSLDNSDGPLPSSNKP